MSERHPAASAESSTPPTRVRVLLCDDHELVRGGLKALLESDLTVEVVGEAGSADQAIRFAAEVKPDVVDMDIRMPGRSGIEACREITLKPWTQVEELQGDSQLERVRWRNSKTGTSETHEVEHLFLMTGANPNTAWLKGCLALDSRQFIKTGSDLGPDWSTRRAPHLRVCAKAQW